MALLIQELILCLIFIFALFFIVLYLYFTRNFNFWKELGVPYVKPVPFVGNLKELVFLKIGIGPYLENLYKDHKDKPYVGIFAFDQPSLVIRDLEIVKNILVKDAQNFIDRKTAFNERLDPFFGKTMFTLKGQRWRHIRVNLTPVFTSGKMKMMFYLVKNCAKELAQYLDRETAEGPVVEVKEAMGRFTTDVITSCAFGIDSNSLKNPEAEFRRYLRNIFGPSVRQEIVSLMAFFAPHFQNFIRLKFLDDNTSNFIRRTVWRTVEYREKNEISRKDFLNCMIELRNKGKERTEENKQPADSSKNNPKFKIDGDDFVAQAFAFLAAGFETTATTMTFALYELAFHQDEQQKLRTEITQVLSKHQGELTYDALQEMLYLDMVVSETLRKYPILPFLDRKCVCDYKLPDPSGKGTVVLPAGTGVYIPIIAIHNDPKYFSEPEKFDPERFTEETKKSRPNYTYFPFGEGPRICIGMRFGLMQVKTGLAQILSRYEISPCKDTPLSIAFDPKTFLLCAVGDIPLSFNRHKA
ncbi:cytochrome P450 6j1-like [Zootermopsis nevadensis]|uniref:cytochrome P450 6j1-like n=1 Tax=Zootermopsis nevadensis TaxID=136037 RepID=UPI000B8E4924|nr:cytochrome P450 6j1-like [Zootermopsis nevadensis]